MITLMTMLAFALYCYLLVFLPVTSSSSSSYSSFTPDSFFSTRPSKLTVLSRKMSEELQRYKRRSFRSTQTATNSSINHFMTTPVQSKELRFPWLRSVTSIDGMKQELQLLKQNKGSIQEFGYKHESRNSSRKNELKISQKSSNDLKSSRRNISPNYGREANASITKEVFKATSFAYIEGPTKLIFPEGIKTIMITKDAKTVKNQTTVLTVAILSLNRIEFSWKSHSIQLEKSTDRERKKYFLLGPKSILSKTEHLIISGETEKSNRNQVKPTEDCTMFPNQSCIVWLKETGPYKFGVFAIINGEVYGEDDEDYEDGEEKIIVEPNELIKVEEVFVNPQKREPPSLIGCHWSDNYRGEVMDTSVTTKLVFSEKDSLVITCQVVGEPRPNVVWCRQKTKKSAPSEDIYDAQDDDDDHYHADDHYHHQQQRKESTSTCLSWNFTKTEDIYSTFNMSSTSTSPSSSSSSPSPSPSNIPSVSLTVTENHTVLTIKEIVQPEHDGVWSLKISNLWGHLELEPFEIDIAELPPFHHKDDWGLQVENGQSARLLCRYVGVLSNRLVYVWRRSSGQNDPNPMPVEHNERIILSHDGSLIFVHTTPDDDGYYMCGVKSAHVDSGTQFGSLCKLTITGPNYEGHPSSPKLVHHSPLTELVFSGQSITLQCVFSGKPIPKIHWFGPNEQVIKSNSKSSENSLKLTSVTLNDEGSYKCRAENEDGRSDGVEFKVMVRKLPTFVTKPLSVNATVGQNVSFSTLITGQPFPRIRWFKNGQQINQSRETNSGMEMKSQVTMWNVTLSDVSTLSCHLLHSEGQVVAWAQLNVFEPLRMTKSPEDLHLSHSKSSNENQGSIVRFHCGVISDQSLPVQLRWVRGIKLAQREVPRLEGRTYVTDGGTLTLNLTSFLGKLRKFYSKEGPTVIEHFKQSHDKPRAVPTDDEANDEDDESYYPYYDDDDIRAAASIFYTCKMNDSLHFIEASARLRLLPSPSTNIHISKSTNNGRADVRDFNIVGQNINDDVMTQEVRGYAEDQSESQSVESKILMWGKNLLGDTTLLGIAGGVISFTILIFVTICLVRRRRFRRKSKLKTMREGSFVLRNTDPSPATEQIEAGIQSNERSKKWVKPSRFGISPDARMCRHLGNMAEAGLYDDLQEMFVPRSRIKLGECVGIGQFGRVFSALMCHERLKIEERVAVKTMKYKPEETEMAELFLREAVLMRGFKHPHVLGVIGVTFDPDGSPMVVLPFMANGDMRTYIMNSKLFITVLELLKMSLQIAYGMIYLSSIRFVHRDLAARNCMVDDRGLVKVADFGLSRELMVRDYYRLCHNKTPVPVRWMALECLEANVFTTMSDVWSYGILLWELLTRGSVPYADLENWEVIGHVQKGLRPSQPAYCPDSVYQMMQSCWNPDPNERPTFQQLAQDIELIIESANALERCVQSTSSGIEKVVQSATCSTLTGASCRSPIYNGSDSSTLSSQFNTFGKKRNLSRDELELNLLPE